MKNTRYFFNFVNNGVLFAEGKRPADSVVSFISALRSFIQNDYFSSAEFSFLECSLFIRHLRIPARFRMNPKSSSLFECDFWVLVKESGCKDTTKF